MLFLIEPVNPASCADLCNSKRAPDGDRPRPRPLPLADIVFVSISPVEVDVFVRYSLDLRSVIFLEVLFVVASLC